MPLSSSGAKMKGKKGYFLSTRDTQQMQPNRRMIAARQLQAGIQSDLPESPFTCPSQ